MQLENSKGMPPDRREYLWDRFLNGRLENSGAQELLDDLEKNPEDLDRRRADAALHAGLNFLLEPPERTRPLVLSVQARLKGARPGAPSRRFKGAVMESLKRKPRRHIERTTASSFRRVVQAFAALVFIGVLLVYALNRSPDRRATQDIPPQNSVSTASLQMTKGFVMVGGSSIGPSSPVPFPINTGAVLGADAQAILSLPDGSRLELSNNACFTLFDPQKGTRVSLKKGHAVVHASKQPDGTAFKLETPHATATVVGTRYTAQVFDSLSCVSVAEGVVEVSSSQATAHKPVQVKAGQEIRSAASGLGDLLRSENQRILEPSLGRKKQFTDSAQSSPLPGETFRGMALQRLSCVSSRMPDAIGYCGWEWPVKLVPGEDRVEMWIKPHKVELANQVGVPTLVLLANLGATEYRIGEIQVMPADHDWMLLTGRLDDNAPLNWVKTETMRLPLRVESVLSFELRGERGNFEFQHTGVVIWKR